MNKDIITMKKVTVDLSDEKKPIVTILMQNDKEIKCELYPDIAPITVENFMRNWAKCFLLTLAFQVHLF